jgi:SAM-dependent methyltransferase
VSTPLFEAGQEIRRALVRLASALPLPDGRLTTEACTSISVIDGESWAAAVRLWRTHGLPLLSTVRPRACPVCATVESRRLFESYDGYDYVECSHCGIWYVPLQVDWTLFERFRECCPDADRLVAETALRRHESLREQDQSRIQGYLEQLVAFLPPRERAFRYLDIGCGVGHSLEAATMLGLVSHGVEADRTSRRLAANSGGLVFEKTADLPDGTYDLVTFWETLEHLSDPAEMIGMAVARLAPGGLVSCSVPNGRASGLRISRERCSYVYGGFDSPGHINFFDVNALRQLFESAGLRLIDARQEFSTNLLEVLDTLAGAQQHDHPISGGRWPAALAGWVEALGPEIGMLESVCGTLPMLHCTACRMEDEELYRDRCEEIRQCRSRAFASDARARLESLADPLPAIARMEADLLEKGGALKRLHDHLQGEVRVRDDALREKDEALRRLHDHLQGEVRVRDDALREKDEALKRLHDHLQDEVRVRDDALREKSDALDRLHEHLQGEVGIRDRMLLDQHNAYLLLCEEVARLREAAQNGGE